MRSKPYSSLDPLYITRLRNNYRRWARRRAAHTHTHARARSHTRACSRAGGSHEGIIELPSSLFYRSRLRACADRELVDSMLPWLDRYAGGGTPASAAGAWSGKPVVFFGVEGQQLHEVDSPSYYNPVEASKVLDFVRQLLASSAARLSTNDVGVIVPFRKQVVKLRRLLRSCDLGAVRVGTVDDYQGQEERVIIISTVVSDGRTVARAAAGGGGGGGGGGVASTSSLLHNPKSFNVALTRAQALTIVVGNPHALYEDEHWRALLRFTVDADTYRGCRCPQLGVEEESDGLAFAERLAAQSLLGAGAAGSMFPSDLYDFHRDPDDVEWRVML